MGLYSPIAKRWRNGDCRSKAWDLGLKLTGQAKKFDKPMKWKAGPIFFLVLEIADLSNSIYQTFNTCTKQLKSINDSSSPWTSYYELMADD